MFTKATPRRLIASALCLALLCHLAACGDDEASSSQFYGDMDAGAQDSSVEASPDDSSRDTTADGSQDSAATPDSQNDASTDAVSDTAKDAIKDTSSDTAHDSTKDAPTDSSKDAADSSTDAGYDGGTGTGWIGSPCDSSYDCSFANSICLTNSYPGGMCTTTCAGLCPDSSDPNDLATFCIEDPANSSEAICVAKCDWLDYPTKGCRSGYVCRIRQRSTDAKATEEVCLPDDGSFSTKCVGDEVRQPNVGIVEAAGIGGCRSGMAPIQGSLSSCIDVYEAHLNEVLASGQLVPFCPYLNPGAHRVMALSAKGAVPQGYITEVQSAAACAEAGKRLCTQAEWELACKGTSNQTYPYGTKRIAGKCNDSRSKHPVIEYFGTSDSWIWSELGNSCISQLPSSLASCGAYSGCVTTGGIHDLMGNLHREWIADPAGTFKGGFYVDTVLNGEGCLYTTTAHNVAHWDYSTGFRCCADK